MQLSNEQVRGIPLTDWFPPEVKPVRVGWYQRKYDLEEEREFPDYWDGADWFVASKGGEIICKSASTHPWRGLSRNPKLEGRRRAEKGIAQALDHAGDWKHDAMNKLREFVAKRIKILFAFEDFRAWALENGLANPPHSNAWGGIAQHAMHLGIIKFTGKYRPAVSPLTHGHCVRLYSV